MRKFIEASFIRNPLFTTIWCDECEDIHLSHRYNPRYKMCNKCRNEILEIRREAEKRDNLARYLLKRSCQRAFWRAGKRKGYLEVMFAWNHWKDMMVALMANEIFWATWCKQTENKYRKILDRLNMLQKGTKRYETTYKALEKSRPTIDRINPGGDEGEGGDYTLDNIQCLPHLKNVRKDSVKKYVLIQGKSHQSIMSRTKAHNMAKILDAQGIECEVYQPNDLMFIVKYTTIDKTKNEDIKLQIQRIREKLRKAN